MNDFIYELLTTPGFLGLQSSPYSRGCEPLIKLSSYGLLTTP